MTLVEPRLLIEEDVLHGGGVAVLGDRVDAPAGDVEDDGVVVVVECSVAGAGVAGPLGHGPVTVGDDAVQVLGNRGAGVEGGHHLGEEAVEDFTGAGPGAGDRDVAADRPGCLRGEAGAERASVAALQGGDVPGDDAARFLGAHGLVLSLVLCRTRARIAAATWAGASWWAMWPAPSTGMRLLPGVSAASSRAMEMGTALSRVPCT